MATDKVKPMWLTIPYSPCKYGCTGLQVTSAGKAKYREDPRCTGNGVKVPGCRLPGAQQCCISEQENTRLKE